MQMKRRIAIKLIQEIEGERAKEARGPKETDVRPSGL